MAIRHARGLARRTQERAYWRGEDPEPERSRALDLFNARSAGGMTRCHGRN